MSDLPKSALAIGDPIRTSQILQHYQLQLKKSLGQNFLTNARVINGIIAAADLQPDDLVIEIGPGIGALTEQLAKRVSQVMAVEIDQRLIPILQETLAAYDNIEILHQDVLHTDLAALLKGHHGYRQVKVVANLPYYITTPIMFHLISGAIQPDRLVLMMQKEVAQRVIAKPGHKTYGPLSIGVQILMAAKIDQIVPKTAFYPQPNVDSAVLTLHRYQTPPVTLEHPEQFQKLVQASFKQRRKSLRNNLVRAFGKSHRDFICQALQQLALPEQVRAEQLSITDFVRLTALLVAEGLFVA